jgi:hypothetical protein
MAWEFYFSMVYGSQYKKTLKSYLYLAINFIQSMIALEIKRGKTFVWGCSFGEHVWDIQYKPSF